jgi:hypothetical protein
VWRSRFRAGAMKPTQDQRVIGPLMPGRGVAITLARAAEGSVETIYERGRIIGAEFEVAGFLGRAKQPAAEGIGYRAWRLFARYA